MLTSRDPAMPPGGVPSIQFSLFLLLSISVPVFSGFDVDVVSGLTDGPRWQQSVAPAGLGDVGASLPARALSHPSV
ncbi:hypothetical protein EYF80_038026 [Liparis tanakae]|uniref:Uncharacterized protein n=1 Tax=Liparis tanakae TaxID=230148 RepID=A0A4Z2GEX9_9TELE|nr:hypothetical protein EYF80_038026 [Liparis tanakae]